MLSVKAVRNTRPPRGKIDVFSLCWQGPHAIAPTNIEKRRIFSGTAIFRKHGNAWRSSRIASLSAGASPHPPRLRPESPRFCGGFSFSAARRLKNYFEIVQTHMGGEGLVSRHATTLACPAAMTAVWCKNLGGSLRSSPFFVLQAEGKARTAIRHPRAAGRWCDF